MDLNLKKPCLYCCAYRDDADGDPYPIDLKGNRLEDKDLRAPHPRCLDAVAEYEADKELRGF